MLINLRLSFFFLEKFEILKMIKITHIFVCKHEIDHDFQSIFKHGFLDQKRDGQVMYNELIYNFDINT